MLRNLSHKRLGLQIRYAFPDLDGTSEGTSASSAPPAGASSVLVPFSRDSSVTPGPSRRLERKEESNRPTKTPKIPSSQEDQAEIGSLTAEDMNDAINQSFEELRIWARRTELDPMELAASRAAANHALTPDKLAVARRAVIRTNQIKGNRVEDDRVRIDRARLAIRNEQAALTEECRPYLTQNQLRQMIESATRTEREYNLIEQAATRDVESMSRRATPQVIIKAERARARVELATNALVSAKAKLIEAKNAASRATASSGFGQASVDLAGSIALQSTAERDVAMAKRTITERSIDEVEQIAVGRIDDQRTEAEQDWINRQESWTESDMILQEIKMGSMDDAMRNATQQAQIERSKADVALSQDLASIDNEVKAVLASHLFQDVTEIDERLRAEELNQNSTVSVVSPQPELPAIDAPGASLATSVFNAFVLLRLFSGY